MKSIITLYSGGLDSTLMVLLLRDSGYNVFPIFINYGQINYKREIFSAQHNAKFFNFNNIVELNISNFGKVVPSGITNDKMDIVKDAFLPNRNLLFLLCASSYGHVKDVHHIAIGLLDEKVSIFPDQTKNFILNSQNVLSQSLGSEIRISAPLLTFSKQDVIKMALDMGIHSTYSCHAGGDTPCGKCIACREFISKEE